MATPQKLSSVIIFAIIILIFTSLTYASEYEYDVSGYGDSGSVYGEIEASSNSRSVDGYIYDEEGNQKYFSGEWSGNGEVEGYDEDGNYYELEVD